jgi:hypothetical protein
MLSDCGFTRSPAEGLQFQAPAGWKSSPGVLGFMQLWRPAVDDGEVLMLIKSPRPIQVKDAFSNSTLNGTLKDVTVRELRAIQLCGSQPATYLAASGSSSRGGKDEVEMVMTSNGGNTYFAMYVRPQGMTPNAAASAAVRELCPKP